MAIDVDAEDLPDHSTNRRAASTTAASSYSSNPFKSMRRGQERGIFLLATPL